MTDTTNMSVNTVVTNSNFMPLGEVLLAARTGKKLTQKDVSNNLRFSVNQINAIENNDFSALPESMITRGFIRNYARLLEIDAEPLLASYRMRIPDKTPSSVSVQSSIYQVMSGKENQPWLKYILGSIFVLLFLLAWILYIDFMPKPTENKAEIVTDGNIASPLSVEAILPEVALPAAERVDEMLPNSAVPASENLNSKNVDSVKTPESLPGTASAINKNINTISQNKSQVDQATPQTTLAQSIKTPDTQQVTSTNTTKTLPAELITSNTLVVNSPQTIFQFKATPSVVSTKASQVSMTFTAPTWIQVTDKYGKVIFEKILSTGSIDGFDGEKPFSVVIGNAKATKLSFLGQAIDLAAYTTENNVARIKLE